MFFFVTWLLRLDWLVCRSVSYYTTLHDWVIKLFQTRWQNWAAFKTHKKCGRRIFPRGFLASRDGYAAKTVPRAKESRQLRRLLNLLLSVGVSMFFELLLIYHFLLFCWGTLIMNIFKFFRDFSGNVIKELHNETFMNFRSLLRL